MKTLNELHKDLETYKDFDIDPGNIEKFLDTVDTIVLIKDPSSIPVLLQYFDDESEYSWVCEELIGSVEYYEPEDYVKHLLENFNVMQNKAKEYLSSLLFHILNSPEHVSFLKKYIHLPDRDALLNLFDVMEKESPHHTQLIQELRQELLDNF